MAGRFGSVLTAMVTPFESSGDGAGAVDLDAAATIARWLVDQGNDGLVVAGTTGEAPVLSDDEHLSLVAAVAEAVTVPVIAGTGSNDTAHAAWCTSEVGKLGAAGALVVSPYYNKPPPSGMEAHYRAVAAATDLPVVIYDVPGRTGRRIPGDVLRRLFTEVPNAVAFKDATGDVPAAAALIADVGEHFELISGDDSLTLPFLSVGAKAVIGVSTHWATPEFRDLFDAWDKSDVVAATAANQKLLAGFEFANRDTCVFAQSAKAALRVLGLPAGECRLPYGPAPDGTEDRAREVLLGLGRDL